jgi:hypothetical protein
LGRHTLGTAAGRRSSCRLDNFGWVEIEERKIDLHSRYRTLDGRIYPLILEVFGNILPK